MQRMSNARSHIKFQEATGKVVLKPITEIEQLCHFTWQENINGIPDFSGMIYHEPHQTMSDNSAKLVLAKISEEVGYGVLLDIETAAIEANQPICMYEGEEIISEDGRYRLGAINALFRSNIARFVDHLPTRVELLQYEFKFPLTAADVAAANTDIIFLDNSGCYPVLVSNQRINPGDFFGYSYNDDYWLHLEIEPTLFTKNGKPIDKSLYSKTGAQKALYDLTMTTMQDIRESGWSTDEIENACSHCASIEEFNTTLLNMTLSLCSKAANNESLFWMSLHLKHILNILEQITLQFDDLEKATLLSEKTKPLKLFYRLFDRSNKPMTVENIDSVATHLESLFDDESLKILEAELAPQKENLSRFKKAGLI